MRYYLTTTSARPAFVIEARDLAGFANAARLLLVEGEEVAHAVEIAAVPTVEAARAAFAAHVANEEYRDNYREAFADDAAGMAAYEAAEANGCCGSADRAFLVAGRVLRIGCNFGH